MKLPSPSSLAALLRQPVAALFSVPRSRFSLLASPAAKRRFPFAVRAGLCCAIPVMAGYFAGDIKAGLLATIGSFSALYGSDRPYRNRAAHLAVIAVALAAVVALGIWVAPHKPVAVVTVALIAALATLVCDSLRIGPPGAYMFALACASGTGMAASGADPWRSGGYVLCGGIVSWLAHMIGALLERRGPERAVTAAAADAVAAFAEAIGTPGADAARHRAASALDDAWSSLMIRQPARARVDPVLEALRCQDRRLHSMFSRLLAATGAQDRHAAQRRQLAREARELGAQARHARRPSVPAVAAPPPPRPQRVVAPLRQDLVPGSDSLLLAARVGVATLIAGGIGLALGLDRAYWGMAATVVVLNQAQGWSGTFRRACHRVSGTLAGLIVAWGVLAAHPQGLWIALTVGLLQFVIEIWVVQQYAIAAVFITANALTIAAGGAGFPAVTPLFTARALDTVIGCAVALAVFFFTGRRLARRPLRGELVRTLCAAQRVLRGLADRQVATPDAFAARRELEHRAIVLQQVLEAEPPAPRRDPPLARRLAATVAATQELVYRLLDVCREREAAPHADTLPATASEDCLLAQAWLDAVMTEVESRAPQRWPDHFPGLFGEQIAALADALRSAPQSASARRS
ncbi:FUSC family protein [Burkholderia perseverans]|uniref:FUSC family protein n=1 Tax=Burkholderia perseverans TaxID=2615214 RepID=UPI001FEDE2EF|nr:FUSC family protein [Burkholderia perseverans]